MRHVAVVRYDAFTDTGGQLSWSMALLDDSGSGVVLTAIQGRNDSRTYAKNVAAWGSETQLSPEEEDAISNARPAASPGGRAASEQSTSSRVTPRIRGVNILTPLAVRIGAIPWMPRLLPQITATDKFIQRVTKGRVTILDIAGLPNLMLTVKGRKSGVPRTTPLLCVPYEDGNLIAGSNFGGAKKPVWVVNVRAAAEKGEPVGVRVNGVTTRPPSARSPAPSATGSGST